jgi:hypothetical protein
MSARILLLGRCSVVQVMTPELFGAVARAD